MELSAKVYARFWSYVLIDPDNVDACWIWAGPIVNGYGSFRIERTYRAHRIAHELMLGEIPPGRDAHHVCRCKRCVNPAHLQLVTRSEHTKIHHSGKTHCKRGHPLVGDNVRVTPTQRVCRICVRLHSRTYRERQKAAV